MLIKQPEVSFINTQRVQRRSTLLELLKTFTRASSNSHDTRASSNSHDKIIYWLLLYFKCDKMKIHCVGVSGEYFVYEVQVDAP